jgi:hypothetical protein
MEGRYPDDRSYAHLCCCKQLGGEGKRSDKNRQQRRIHRWIRFCCFWCWAHLSGLLFVKDEAEHREQNNHDEKAR